MVVKPFFYNVMIGTDTIYDVASTFTAADRIVRFLATKKVNAYIQPVYESGVEELQLEEL